jgi:hypothetical protein
VKRLDFTSDARSFGASLKRAPSSPGGELLRNAVDAAFAALELEHDDERQFRFEASLDYPEDAVSIVIRPTGRTVRRKPPFEATPVLLIPRRDA